MISEMLGKPSNMDAWLKLPKISYGSGTTGADASNRWASTRTYRPAPTSTKSKCPEVSQHEYDVVASVTANKLVLNECKLRYAPSARPAKWC